MALVLTDISAYEYWRSAISHDSPVFGELHNQRNLAHILHVADEKSLGALKRTPGTPGDLHLLAFDPKDRRRPEGVCYHCVSKPDSLPPGSVWQVSHGIYTVSPELCLVQLASHSTFLETLRYGTDLCSRYQLDLFDRMVTVDCEPMTNRDRIGRFLDALPKGTPGIKQARRALRWIVEGTRSPRETSMCMLMNLPTKLGGFCLLNLTANHKIPLEGKAAVVARKQYLEADAICEGLDRIFEYESLEHHDNPLQEAFDYEKITALQIAGYTVTPISTWQMSNFDAFEALMVECKHQMGQRDRQGELYSPIRRETHYEVLRLEREQRESPSLAKTRRWKFLMPRI